MHTGVNVHQINKFVLHVCLHVHPGASFSQAIPLSVTDCRGIVKTLVCGMKTITWGAGSCKVPGAAVDFCKFVSMYAYMYCSQHVHVWLTRLPLMEPPF